MKRIDEADWIAFTGDLCPVDPDLRVEVKFDKGHTVVGLGRDFVWGGPSGIVAYRVLDLPPKVTARDRQAGDKYDHGKPMMGLLLKDFANALSLVGEVTTFGAAKYAPSNWLKVSDAERRYLDAMCRHLFADLRGDECDDESGMPHLAHAAWCILAVLELRKRSGEGSSDTTLKN